jgi:hypothetical protein
MVFRGLTDAVEEEEKNGGGKENASLFSPYLLNF